MSDEPETNELPEAVSEEPSQKDEDLDSILSEWSESEEETPQAKTPLKSPDDIVAEVEARLTAKQDYENTLKTFVTSCSDLPFDVSPGVIEGWLNERARKDPAINSVYSSKNKNPKAWDKVQARLIDEFKGQFKLKESSTENSDREAAMALARGSSNKEVPEKPMSQEDVAKLSDREFEMKFFSG